MLGGSGITGIAWELGVLHGLAQRGVDLALADVVVGTSAGSVVGAQLGGDLPVDELYRRQLEPASSERAHRMGPGVLARYLVTLVLHPDRRSGRAKLGAMARRARLDTSPDDRRKVIASRLPSTSWPDRFDLRITAVDADSGEPEVFRAASGVELVDAVAASCAVPLVWPTVPIGDRHYIDGGMRSGSNVDLVGEVERVVVLAPIPGGSRRADRPDRQLAALGAGVRGLVVSPSDEARRAIGRNPLDPARRRPAAEAGLAQSAEVAAAVAAVWD